VDAAVFWAAGFTLALGSVFFLTTGAPSWALRAYHFAGGAMILAAGGTFYLLGEQTLVAARANDRRCLAIQHDMLRARPQRADGADLFQALGCRPQGEGSVYALPKQEAAAAKTVSKAESALQKVAPKP
jgi:hypothetical protein